MQGKLLAIAVVALAAAACADSAVLEPRTSTTYGLRPALTADAQSPVIAPVGVLPHVSGTSSGASVAEGSASATHTYTAAGIYSASYDWLVVAGPKAQYKGSGTVNGVGDYGFMLTALDGQIAGGGATDRFRIKIWDKTTEEVVYDNQMGNATDADLATAIGGGSIAIHP